MSPGEETGSPLREPIPSPLPFLEERSPAVVLDMSSTVVAEEKFGVPSA
jgi:hypothetical protein